MADEEKPDVEETEDGEATPKKAAPKIVGGLVGVIALGYLVATMAIPAKFEPRKFSGPLMTPLTPDRITVNLRDDSNKRILVMKLNAEVDSYEANYVPNRTMNPLYMAQIKDALLGLASEKSRSEILGPDQRPIFLEELRSFVEPIVFPVHVGKGASATDVDPESGLAPGLSVAKSDFRGAFDEHVLVVDAAEQTIALDGGEPVRYHGDERDLRVVDAFGKALYVDVTRVKPDFQGEVRVGVMGWLRRVLLDEIIVQ